MRFIPTTPSKVEALKKQAKRLQRNGGGKHADLLDRVARTAGYDHWHHAVRCLQEAMGVHESRGLLREIEAIIKAALDGIGKAIITGPEASGSQPFVLMSSEEGDAWMLDPESDQVLCLVWHGSRQELPVRKLADRIEIEWHGTFELRGPFFAVQTTHPDIGSRHVAGYPVDELRNVLETARSVDKRIEGIFEREDAVPLEPDVIARLVRVGWDEEQLLTAARQGAQYSPSRDSVLFPPVSSV